MGNLDMDDIRNVERRFPMITPDGRICWAVAGGGATKFLLESHCVVGYEINDKNVRDVRIHKDLDISVFLPEQCQLRLVYPHEIYRTVFCSPPKRCNYKTKKQNYTGFFVELLTDWFFGFPPPAPKDTAKVYLPEAVVYTLSPEYVIASRLFDISPPRKGVDDEDVLRLRAKFVLDEELIVRTVQRGVFGFLSEPTLTEIVHEGNEVLLDCLMKNEIKTRFPNILATIPLTSDMARRLLLFCPGDLNTDRFALACKLADEQHEEWSCWVKTTELRFVLIMLNYGQRNGLSTTVKLTVKSFMEIISLSANHAQYAGIAAHFCKGLIDLEVALANHSLNHIYQELAERTLSAFCKTAFRTVLNAGLAGTNNKLRALCEPWDAYDVLATFSNLIGWRGFARKHGAAR
jgi:hypothetical protein